MFPYFLFLSISELQMGSCVSSQQSFENKCKKKFLIEQEKSFREMNNEVLLRKIRMCPKLALEVNDMYNKRKNQKADKVEATEESRPTSRLSC